MIEVRIYTGDGLYVDDECVDELLFSKIAAFDFMPRKHDLIILDGNEFEVEMVILNLDKHKYEIYAESTREDNKARFEATRKCYIENEWKFE